MRSHRFLVLQLLALLALATACSSGGVDVDALESAIVEAGDEQRADLSPWEAECTDVPETLAEGDVIQCTATDVDGTEYAVTVTATDDDGNVNIDF